MKKGGPDPTAKFRKGGPPACGSTLYGQCACGASLTVEHLWRCPLHKQQRAYEEEDLSERSIEEICRAVSNARERSSGRITVVK